MCFCVDVMADNVNVDEPGESIDKKTEQSDEVLKSELNDYCVLLNWMFGFWFAVDLLLKATGDAPIMKKKKWSVDSNRNIGWIIEFIKRYFKLESSESLVRILFIQNIFLFFIFYLVSLCKSNICSVTWSNS